MGSEDMNPIDIEFTRSNVLFRTIHGILDSVIYLLGSLSNTLRPNTRLLDDCVQVENALTFLQHRPDGNQHNIHSTNRTTVASYPPAKPRTIQYKDVCVRRCLSPPAKQDTATIHHEPDRSKTINITPDEKASAPQSRSKYHETP